MDKLKGKKAKEYGVSQQEINPTDPSYQAEAILAATYDPSGEVAAEESKENSDASCDYVTEVLKVI